MNNVEVENTNLDTFLKEEFTEMTFNLKAKAKYEFKGTEYCWMNKKSKAKYLNCSAHFTSFSKFLYGGI